MKFLDLGLAEKIVDAVTAAGYTTPTPIQLQAIPHVLAERDVLGCAQTGTGKTAAFALPILHRLLNAKHQPPHVVEKFAYWCFLPRGNWLRKSPRVFVITANSPRFAKLQFLAV